MISRFTKIHRKFGLGASVRMALLVVGLVGTSILGFTLLETWWPTAIAVGGVILGFLLRRQIVDIFEWTAWALPTALFVYGILVFIGERLGLSREAQLILITLTTVITFDLQFWSLSDPSIIKLEDDG